MQPRMFDQAFIMRSHQTARSSNRAEHLKHSLKNDLPGHGLLPEMPATAGNWKNVAAAPNEEYGEFRQETNLINYNFNNNHAQDGKTQSEYNGTDAQARPQNTKGMSRFNKNTAGNPLSEHDGYAERASIPTNDISSQ